ncbi:hypothetical protein [Acetobacterium bakii]|uniref:hypothetical protein n=1 Tax=Acetobacterium bakii TaxID=52689 RepID=UPI000AD23AFD|nr:hypothetical protein [Acetobacterium bakii]
MNIDLQQPSCCGSYFYIDVSEMNPMAHNLFIYCNNNPVNNQDPSGRSFEAIFNRFREKLVRL